MATTIRFVDTTLRDGQMSLWATSMSTAMMLPAVHAMDAAGFIAMEILAPAFVKKCVRELHEDPIERIRLISKELRRTVLRCHGSRYIAGFQLTPASVFQLYIERMTANGVRQFRISDPSNTIETIAAKVPAMRAVGLEPIVNLIFSISPRHTDDYYAQKAKEAARLDVAGLCVKDPGGLLTPERTRTLVKCVMAEANGLPIEFHTHCTTGLGPLCCLEAANLGIEVLNTAIPPLANGSSNPSVVNVVHNLQALGYPSAVDLDGLEAVTEHFTQVAMRYGFPLGCPVPYDAVYYWHQVPGGMMSNLRHQLGRMGMADRLPDVLNEIVRVREDLGYPIMVTPYSQFVGTQAVMNVVTGDRYAEVPDEVIYYALGFWGEGEAEAIHADVKDRILARPRAHDLARCEPPADSLIEIRRQLGCTECGDDELLLRYLAGPESVDALPRAPMGRSAWSVGHPLVDLVREVVRRPRVHSLRIERPGLALRLSASLPGSSGCASGSAGGTDQRYVNQEANAGHAHLGKVPEPG